MNKFSSIVLNLFLFLVILDFTGDPIIRSYDLYLVDVEFYYKSFLLILFSFLFFFNFRFKKNITKIFIPYILICCVFFYGLFIGLINNKLFNVLNEFSVYMFILLTPIIVNVNGYVSCNDKFLKYIKIFVFVVIIKIFFYEIITLLLFGIPSFKILLKQTPLFLIVFSILLDKILNKQSGFYFLFFLTCFILLVALARMIYISMAFIILVQFLKNFSFNKISSQLKIFCIIFLSFLLYVNIQSVEIGGTLERLYGGDIYEESVDYRMTQFYVILSRFIEFPFGAGFGYFTPNYLTYGELSKPYLLELDLLNFFSKIGLLFSFFYILIYSLIYKYLKYVNSNMYDSLFSFFIGLVSLLIYSLGQTAHQGFLFWIAFSIFYSTLVINFKSRKI